MILFGQQLISEPPEVTDAMLAQPSLLKTSPVGIALIWTGDTIVAVLAGGMLWRLHRR